LLTGTYRNFPLSSQQHNKLLTEIFLCLHNSTISYRLYCMSCSYKANNRNQIVAIFSFSYTIDEHWKKCAYLIYLIGLIIILILIFYHQSIPIIQTCLHTLLNHGCILFLIYSFNSTKINRFLKVDFLILQL
jgi:hypothetical protein